ncbi:MAG: hypothetical protein AAFR47_11835 [Pseudomonadota bacterium]
MILRTLLFSLLATQAGAAVPLLCLGTGPQFILAVREDRATFDYLGDGTFDFSPAPTQDLGFSAHVLETAGGPLDVFFEARACQAIGLDFPITVEVGVPTSSGISRFQGCCLWQDG